MLDVKKNKMKVKGNPSKPKLCFSCGVKGHFLKDCPLKQEGQGKLEKHLPSQKKQGVSPHNHGAAILNRRGNVSLSQARCFVCGTSGHKKKDCPYRGDSKHKEAHGISCQDNLVQSITCVEEGEKTSSPTVNYLNGVASPIVETEKLGDLEFKWGKKRGVGGKKKEVQFYGSFTFDGMEYNLYDCVYLHKEGEPEPYVGKLIKIWENADKTKKVKVQWFFRPYEIKHWLGNEKVLENEVFLASGEGTGLANVNSLEAIAGKCNVICLSKDSRNPQPSEEEIKKADYVFHCTFDVQHCTILDKMDDKVGGLEIKFIFNTNVCESGSGVPKLSSDMEEDKKNDPLQVSAQNPSDKSNNVKTDEKLDNLSAFIDADVKDSLVKPESLPGDLKEGMNAGEDTEAFDNRPFKKARVDKSTELVEEKSKNEGKNKNLVASASFKEKTISKDSLAIHRRVNSAIDASDFRDKPSKKARVDNSCEVPGDTDRSFQNPSKTFDRNNSKDFAKSRIVTDSTSANSCPPKMEKPDEKIEKLSKEKPDEKITKLSKEKPDEKIMQLSNGKLPKVSVLESADEDREVAGRVFEVTRRPDADKSKWFRPLPWEERMHNAHEQGTLVLLQNLDPKYTSEEVEDIMWHAFKENCAAKMVQRTASSSPVFGQALVILKTREATKKVIDKLDEGCLMLPNGRPLVGCIGPPPCLAKKQSTFIGHLVIDNPKLQSQREMREAVSTSHCSQPNTIEYEMAMEWCLLQSRSDTWWKRLYKQQGEDLKKLKAKLKSK